MADQRFGSHAEATAKLLALVSEQCEIQTAVITRIDPSWGGSTVLAGRSPGGVDDDSGIRTFPLQDTFRSASASAGAGSVGLDSLPVDDVRADPLRCESAATLAFAAISSYISVPIRRLDDSLFGTLYTTDPASH